MKAFIIHTKTNTSLDLAQQCKSSFVPYKNWEIDFFEGTSPMTLEYWEQQLPLKIKEVSRAKNLFLQKDNSNIDKKRYLSKKSCLYSHYRLWKKCVELQETIVILEHDSICKSDWFDMDFDDVMVLNISSAIDHPVLKSSAWRKENPKPIIEDGIGDLRINLIYTQDPKIQNAQMIPGAAAYAISPQGAHKMTTCVETHGWEKNDFVLNTHNIRIQTIVPELFRLRYTDLSTSNSTLK